MAEHSGSTTQSGTTRAAGGLLAGMWGSRDVQRLSPEQLPELAREIRAAIYDQVRVSGGHLAPNLGVVELTIALHYVFDFGPRAGDGAEASGGDRLLFDVGHQCYPHKLLTGRYPLLKDLRTRAGMAGFPEPRESEYDLFRVGHAGTGISTAVGMARGDTLNGEGFEPRSNPGGRRVVTLIGDASIVNGVAMEGLNGAGTLGRQFLVILNDNGMSISHPQGAIAKYFDRIRVSNTYADFKRNAAQVLKHLPGGSLLKEAYHVAGEAAKSALHPSVKETGWFENFGLVTVGPIDGHDLPALVHTLRELRNFEKPVVLHVKTVKGKGYAFAEQDSSRFHSPGAFTVRGDALAGDPDTAKVEGGVPAGLEAQGCRVEIKSEGRSFTAAFGEALTAVMERDPRVVSATAAMPDGTGINKTLARFPERSFDTGICESHALDMMAGLAKTGWRPFFAVYSTFLQRAFDQAFQEAALQGLGVRLCLDRAGLVGGDGAVHHGFCDVALLRTLPDAVLMAALDEPSLVSALELMRGYDTGVSAVRYPRDAVSPRFANECPAFELGRARLLFAGAEGEAGGEQEDLDVAVLAYGTCGIAAVEAAERLAGVQRVAVWDARFAKPVDATLVTRLMEQRTPILTVEDHSVVGGFGAAVLETMHEVNAAGGPEPVRLVRLGIPDRWILQDSRAKQLSEAGLDTAGIIAGIQRTAESAVRKH